MSTPVTSTVTSFKQGHSEMCVCPQDWPGAGQLALPLSNPGHQGGLGTGTVLLPLRTPRPYPVPLSRSLPLASNPCLAAAFSACPSRTPGLSGRLPRLPWAEPLPQVPCSPIPYKANCVSSVTRSSRLRQPGPASVPRPGRWPSSYVTLGEAGPSLGRHTPALRTAPPLAPC